ncbi:MAG: signal peptide peptidase SppA, partial [Planctomycetota bacterium]
VAVINISGQLEERAQPGLLPSDDLDLGDLRDRIRKAATDPAVKALLLEIDPTAMGFAKADQLARYLASFRQTGKPVYAHMTQAMPAMYLASLGADRINLVPTGVLIIPGIRAEVTFYKGTLDWLGIQPEYLQVGRFKGAAEPYHNKEMSEPLRKNLTEIVDGLYRQMIAGIARRRMMKAKDVQALIDKAMFSPEQAREAGLIDTTLYYEDLRKQVENDLRDKVDFAEGYGKKDKPKVDLSNPFALLSTLMGPPRRTESGADKIAVIYATGMIVPDSMSGLSDGVMTPGAIRRALERAVDDKTVKAIVLRIDSPGGSALASDLIWKKVKQTDKVKPVIASFSDVAASGGYYIAMGCRMILAEPSTMTGSIGVAGGKFNLKGLYDKVGLTKDVISRGKRSGLFSTYGAWTDAERGTIVQEMRRTYREFTARVKEARGFSDEQIDKVALGRVFLGTQAVELKLVDKLGGLVEAVAEAKRAAGLDPEKPMELKILPRLKSPLEMLLGSPDLAGANSRRLEEALGSMEPAIARALLLRRVMQHEPVVTALPFVLELK